ncbi:MAG: enoyl-CoA hydratase/isomerase family protein [Proteobacteria bacterium]|nr:enoyl-CoA hydratase/isomerase family protein [Pseudomonadota bacterium]MBU4385326.1 enoyl-CoA hydratase/isomerase family protein [Pseudomonadota bacterium]MCG2764544.1 3-hydroxyacyl-CoA dehydrogenase NAD-binding domain-containing protein [Desulfarculaceae bacterium]
MNSEYQTIKLRIRDGVAILTMNNPPVNQMSELFTQELRAAIIQAQEDPGVKALVLIGTGRNFLAGADVTQLLQVTDKATMAAHLTVVHQGFQAMEQSPKPIIAAINGNCLGGGLELAMACHYRLAAKGVSLGLPEVKMGVIPGGGGTQRLPRIVGLPTALELMTGGKIIKSEKAWSLGLVDELAEGEELLDHALAVAKKFQDGILGWKTRVAIRRIDRLPSAQEKKHIIAASRQKLAKQAIGYIAPFKIVEAVDQGLSADPQADLAREIDLFGDCVVSDVSKNLICLFLSQRAAGKLPRIKGLKSEPLRKVAVLGGGVMGSGIVHLLLSAGLDTVLWDIDQAALDKARQAVAKSFAFQIKTGRLKPAQLEQMLASKLCMTTALEDLSEADLVIEAVVEDLRVKQELWKKLDGVCGARTIFGTNTSALPIGAMASVLADPSRMIGLHFFNPAERMPLLEIICAQPTSDQTLAAGVALARLIKKVPVVVNDGPGFYVTRQLITLPSAALYLLADGVDMEAIDRAVKEFGLPMGPFTLEDLTGLDIGFHVCQTFARELGPRYQVHPLHQAVHGLGDFGRKSGRGYYDYGGPKPVPNPRVREVVADYLAAQGKAPRQAQEGEIVDCLLACAINEAALMMEQDICDRPADMDLAMVQGTGFPAYRGGILRYADKWGLASVHQELLRLQEKYGSRFEPAGLVRKLAQHHGTFYQQLGR